LRHHLRLIFVAVVVFAWTGYLVSQLFILQISRSEELKDRAERQYRHRVVLTPKRGTIFDRYGRTLAINVDTPSLYAVAADVADPAAAAAAIAPIIGRPPRDLERLLRSRRGFVWLQRKITTRQRREIEALGIEGIHFVTESKRVYPSGRLACHVLGFAGIDNDGLEGLEYQYDSHLKGKPGLMIGIRGAKRGYIFSTGKVLKLPTGGHDIRLTIDSGVQFVVEQELRTAVETAGARSGTVVVLDHESGAVLAMANYPDFDPNNYGRASAFARRNRAVVDAYEPGSSFKIVTASAALSLGLIGMDEEIDCGNGLIQIGRRTIHDHHPYDKLTFRDVIAKSSNVGAIRVGRRVGEEQLWRMAASFGFGSPTGIDLPAENPGLLRPIKRWTEGSIGSISIGQEVSGNPVQITLLAAAIANGGYRVKPFVVEAIYDAEGREIYRASTVRHRILSDTTVRLLRELTRGVVTDGTGTLAEIPGIQVAGKTGTAQVSSARGGYIPGAYVADFVGYFPFENPRLTMLCLIDQPQGEYEGGSVAAPLFERIGARLVRYLEVPRRDQRFVVRETDPPRPSGESQPLTVEETRPGKRVLSYPASSLVMPDVRGLSLRDAVAKLVELGVVPTVEGFGGVIVAQVPAPGEPIGGRTVIRRGGTRIAR